MQRVHAQSVALLLQKTEQSPRANMLMVLDGDASTVRIYICCGLRMIRWVDSRISQMRCKAITQ